ncbi:hypothetical protein Bca52824_025306 [Brassica carinata]|uniref:Uncharacterized protein n=1 Tax=Brassica carinata TaxID=52824 RepID=A0A8X8AUS2_BRACI|nr:hypothetical protein Bca52824_025306 [Brassica carinata]
MQDERVDLMMDMIHKMYDWSKHEWVSWKLLNQCWKVLRMMVLIKRRLEKQVILVMLKSSVTALALEVRDIVDDRFAKLEDNLLSSQTPGGAPADTQTQGGARGADPFYTPSAAAAPTLASTKAPAPTSTRAPVPTPTSTRTTVTAPSRSRAPATSQTGGPANAAKTRSQTKDPELSDVFGSLFSTLDDNLGTQEHLQKTMGNLTQESNRPFLSDIDDPEVRCKDSDYKLVFVPEDKWSKLIEWTLNPTVLQIGPSKFDAELASRIVGPNIWFKNYDMDAMMYLFREKTSLRRWKPDRHISELYV